jgi:aryl-alcohol dehydrogenase-like predicted oxidoreductase
MEYTTLGRTGLRVSVAGLGCGGGSRLGLARGNTAAEAVNIVRQAVDLGVNLIDTAQTYGTESVVGEALQGLRRDSLVVSTKHLLWGKEGLYSPEHIVAGLDNSLRLLRTDYIDVFFLHALTLRHENEPLYTHAVERIIPTLLREQEKGKFRFLGATGAPNLEPHHDAIARAIDDDVIDVAMIAFSLFNQNSRELVFPKALAHDVGTMLMFVVRNIFADNTHLRFTIQKLAREGRVPGYLAEKSDPLDFLIHAGGAGNHLDAAYRYARHEPGADVVLFGSGNAEHIRRNVASINAPPLPDTDRLKMRELFGHLVGVGLDIPESRVA